MTDKLATKEPQREEWKIQYSWKLRNDMLNLRANSVAEFREALKELSESPEMIIIAGTMFQLEEPAPTPTQQTLQPVVPIQPAAQPAPVAPKGDEVEVGPITVTKPSTTRTASAPKGRPYTRHTVTFSSGVKASTFDALVADVAQNLLGKPAYARVEKSKFGDTSCSTSGRRRSHDEAQGMGGPDGEIVSAGALNDAHPSRGPCLARRDRMPMSSMQRQSSRILKAWARRGPSTGMERVNDRLQAGQRSIRLGEILTPDAMRRQLTLLECQRMRKRTSRWRIVTKRKDGRTGREICLPPRTSRHGALPDSASVIIKEAVSKADGTS